MTRTDFARLFDAALAGQRKTEGLESLGEQVSLTRSLGKMQRGESLDGVEAEAHAELTRSAGKDLGVGEGVLFPFSGLRPRKQRDMQGTVFNAGGAFVQTDVSADYIELLLNKTTARRLGAKTVSGLRGNLVIPKITAPPKADAVPETGKSNLSNPLLDQVASSPRRITITVPISRQLLLQTNSGTEDFLRSLIGDMVMLKLDELFYHGQGVNSEPLGVTNLLGTGSVLFGGAASYANMVSFETVLANSNADTTGRLGYVSTPATRAKLKLAPKIGSTFPDFVYENFNWGDGTNDGIVNGYRFAATNQISGNLVIFGAFEDSIICIWMDGMEIVRDIFTRATEAVIQLTVHLWADVIFRHPQAFAVSADSGAQ